MVTAFSFLNFMAPLQEFPAWLSVPRSFRAESLPDPRAHSLLSVARWQTGCYRATPIQMANRNHLFERGRRCY